MPARSRWRCASPALRRPRHQHDIGDLNVKISGCINACGHHHVGHIGDSRHRQERRRTLPDHRSAVTSILATPLRHHHRPGGDGRPRRRIGRRAGRPLISTPVRTASASPTPIAVSASPPSRNACMPLYRENGVVDDPWLRLDDEAAVPVDGLVLVNFARWRAARPALLARRRADRRGTRQHRRSRRAGVGCRAARPDRAPFPEIHRRACL